MTVHMIRVRCDIKQNTTETQLREACELWTSNYNETLLGERLTVTHSIADNGAPEHYTGWWRFQLTDDQAALLNDLEATLSNRVTWAVIDRRACEHDTNIDARGACTRAETRTIGTIPAGIA